MLWIEDEESVAGAGRLLLGRAGFAVEVVGTAASGLVAAGRDDAHWAAIVLDWRLPDADGGFVFSGLKGAGVLVPTIVFSAYGDQRDAALRQGAAAFVWKQDRFPALIRALQSLGISAAVGARSSSASEPWTSRARARLADARASGATREATEALAAWLAACIVRETLSIPEFLAAAGLLCALQQRDVRSLQPLEALLGPADVTASHCSQAVGAAVSYLETSGDAHVTEDQLAGRVGTSASHFGRCLREETGIEFRRWRLGLRLRGALRELADRRVRLAEIAGRWGWTDEAEFSRMCHDHVGGSPSAIRTLASLDPGAQA